MERNGLSVAKKLIAKCKCEKKSFSAEILDDTTLGLNKRNKSTSLAIINNLGLAPVFIFKWDCCGLKVIVNGRLGSVLS
jgi:hypothetical protein